MSEADHTTQQWDRLLRAIVAFQTSYGGHPLLGGTASALYAGHRASHDADYAVADLRERFNELLTELDADDRWVLKRRRFGQVLLGRFEGIETGLRQLRRAVPLETQVIGTEAGEITLPTHQEMIRIKGFLILDRCATRDFLDFAALGEAAGDDATREALRSFNRCYHDVERDGSKRDTDPLLELQWRLDQPVPTDLACQPPETYQSIQPPWDDWQHVVVQCERIARTIDLVLCEDTDEDADDGPSL